MAVCPNCSFVLVVLPKRRRYKCAKCSRLYPERFVDNREFRRYNQIQRGSTIEETESYFEEIWKAFKLLTQTVREKPKPRKKLSEEERKQRAREYRKKNRARILLLKKKYREKHKDKINSRERQRRIKIRAHLRTASRKIWHEKKDIYNKNRREKKQLKKALALMGLKNNDYSPCKGKSRSQMADFYFSNYCNNQNVFKYSLSFSFLFPHLAQWQSIWL